MLECVQCHNPHEGVKQLEQAKLPTTRMQCVNCHFEKVKQQKNAKHAAMNMPCVECHMPNIIQIAWGDPAKFTADFRTHRMAIDPTLIEQTYTSTDDQGNEKTYSISADQPEFRLPTLPPARHTARQR